LLIARWTTRMEIRKSTHHIIERHVTCSVSACSNS
jgi:hypothetical protein